MVKVLIFEDSPSRQEALKLLIDEQSDLQLLGIFENCVSVVENVERLNPDVILMDIEMPVVNGLEGVKLIRKHFPDVIVIMQTVFEDESSIFEAIQAGAHGYMLKSTKPARFIDAIKDALEGGAPMTPLIAKKVMAAFKEKQSAPKNNVNELSETEMSILSILAEGKSYKMVAVEKEISWHTVNAHVKKIYKKLHVHSAAEAIYKMRNH
jgi:DNA-binding NarL/FixJ family response regulator